ncbi:MAG: hypothetical protein IKO62_00705 [Bacteroidales bacterium]|nr:hypothetical protein [Bacteroidales bacterium]
MRKIVAFILLLVNCTIVFGQVYKIGDLYTAPDGSQGIIFYLYPNGTGGWMVALNDASSGCMWGTNEDIPDLINQSPLYYQQLLNDTAGYTNTSIIRNFQNNNNQYAAGVVDFTHGWYLPSISQLSMLFSKLPLVSTGLIAAGGNVLAYDWYWSSTENSATDAWRVDFGVSDYSGYFNYTSKNTMNRVRAIREFSTVSMSYDSTLTYLWNTGSEQPFISVSPEQTSYYSVTATSVYGCSSSANQTVVVGTGIPTSIIDEICQGFRYNANGFVLTEDETSTAGVLTRTRMTETGGCEAELTLHLTVLSKDSVHIFQDACGSYTYNGVTYYESGIYNQYYNNMNGCDSVVVLHLNLYPEFVESEVRTICPDALPYDWDGTVFTYAGSKVISLSTVNGCDSIVTKVLNVYPVYNYTILQNVCESDLPYTWNGEVFTETGSSSVTLLSIDGCDSTVTMMLTVSDLPRVLLQSSADTLCKGGCATLQVVSMVPSSGEIVSYLWDNGETQSSIVVSPNYSDNYMVTVSNADGCAVVLDKEIMVLNGDSVLLLQNSCGNYTLNDVTYQESGTYFQYFHNKNGCDSVVVLQLTISAAPQTIISASADSICPGDVVSLHVLIEGDSNSLLKHNVSIGDILCTDSSFVKFSDWPDPNKIAMGIVFYVDSTGEHGWAVHLNDQGNNIRWGTLTSDIIPLANYAIGRDASTDFDGFVNTQSIRAVGDAGVYPAAWLVDVNNGWYLPSAGQLNLLYVSLSLINNSLMMVGGTPFPINAPFGYWSSTEQSQNNVWYLSSLGTIGINPKNSTFSIRSVRSF